MHIPGEYSVVVLTASFFPVGIIGVILLLLYYSYRKYQKTNVDQFSAKTIVQILDKYFGYYAQIPFNKKKEFVNRVNSFIEAKEFVPKEMDAVSEEMKVLVAASAVQITFGLQENSLDHFSHIIIYPDVFYSRADNRMHKGEVNMRGIIVLSWKHFLEGYIDPTDGRNLGLHEMAHALRLEDQFFGEENFPDDLLENWEALAEKEMKLMKSGFGGFFREYATTNKEEFFAVAVEYFFENPAGFKSYNSQLYQMLSKLLNQDPLKNK
jgi:MtfA peptidase